MPDISMCPDDACPYAVTCRRHTQSGTVADPVWQSWLLASPRQGERCEMRLAPLVLKARPWSWSLERDEDGLPARLVGGR